MKINYKEIPYGFEFGAAIVTRLFSDEKKGWVTIEVKTKKTDLQIYITKTGKIRVHGKGEWLPETKRNARTSTNKQMAKCRCSVEDIAKDYVLLKIYNDCKRHQKMRF